ncbi:MAG TPA: glycosyltransferase [Candidatus Saccharimonadales bacterium]|nr:glycosyltransferase [Candidatus Saccharimonadales bacterium]
MKQRQVSIVILNWNGLENTLACLKHVRKINYQNLEVIVVDNGSRDGSKERLRKEKDIVLIDLPSNTGFTGGHIAGYSQAKGDYILLLNNDLVIDPDWILNALETFGRHKDAAAVGGKQYKWDKANPVGNRDNEYYAFQEVNPVNGETYTSLVGEDERPVDSISGAALMIKRAATNKVGYLDNDFFAYYEETDLVARMIRSGYQAYYNPACVAWHKVAASSAGGAESAFYLYQMHRNRYIFAFKNFDPQNLKKFRRAYAAEVRRAFIKTIVRPTTESKARLRAWRWNKAHLLSIRSKRSKVMRLGQSYNGRLNAYKPQDVTVVIPCYNYEAYVSKAIDSALNQSLKPERIIVIDDGSTDGSREAISAYKSNPLVEIIHKKNEGVVAAKNLGIKLSQTYWTIFLDADDIMQPNYIEKLVKLANSGLYDVAYTDMEYFGAAHDIFRSRPFSIFPMLQRNYIHNSALIKTSRLRQVGGYKQEMKEGLEDWELYLSLAEVGSRFGYLPEAIFKYRQHDATLSRNIDVQKNKELELYNRLRELHPGLFRYMNPGRRRLLRALKLMYYFGRYPFLFIVVIKSLPRALKSGLRATLHEVRAYLHQKSV